MTRALADDIKHERRMADVRAALQLGHNMSSLSYKWNITRAGVTQWCEKNISIDDHKRLADNGFASMSARRRDYEIGPRLELIVLLREQGWTWEKIGKALGCATPTAHAFLQRHAANGIAEAIADYSDEEAPASAAA